MCGRMLRPTKILYIEILILGYLKQMKSLEYSTFRNLMLYVEAYMKRGDMTENIKSNLK